MAHAVRVYRVLMKLYPARFREEYGKPLEQQFADEYREADGLFARTAFWLRLCIDLAVSIPRELARELRQDVRYSVRVYARRPAVTLLALAALTFAIGATTGVFSVVNALLLRSLPFRGPEGIVRIDGYRPPDTDAPAAFERWRTHSAWLEDAAIYDSADMNVARSSGTVRLRVTETSVNFFTMLGGEPRIGRGFVRGEDVPGQNTLAVISDTAWRDLFGGDPRALGATFRVNGTPLTIVGVAPRGFDYPARTAIWTPTFFEFDRLPKVDMTLFITVGRVRPGLSLARAQALLEAEVLRARPARAKADVAALRRAGYVEPQPRLVAIRDELAGPVRRASLVLMAAVILVLLVACANVANLLLTRVADRRQELMIRAALGASRARLAQQLVTESVLLALMAASAGLIVARWAASLATAVQPAQVSAQEYAVLDWRVLAFAVCLAVVTGLVFGVFPALMTARLQPAGDLARAHAADGSRAGRLRAVLIAGQVSVTLVLVAGAVATSRNFINLMRTDLGFRADRVVTLTVSLAGARNDDAAARRGYFREAIERLSAIPGVERAAAVDCLPLITTGFSGGGFGLDGGAIAFAPVISVTPGYFRTMGIRMTAGREFDARDTSVADRVAIVNETFARNAGGGGPVLGRTLKMRGGKRTWTIVGVSRAVRDAGPTHDSTPEVYFPVEQATPAPGSATFVLRVLGNPAAYIAAARDGLRGVDRNVSVFDVRSFDDQVANAIARPRFYTTVVVFFSGLALLLALMGVYGVVSHSVVQRTHEVGVRLALGGSVAGVRRHLMKGSLIPVVVGTAIGLAGALASARVLEHLVVAAGRPEAATVLVSALGLNLAAVLAMWRATRRVVRLQPMNVLRSE